MPRISYEPKIISLDTETYNGFFGVMKKIAIYDGEKITYGDTFEDVEKVIMQWYYRGYDPHIYIHNLDFDARKIPVIFDQNHIVWNGTKLINNRYVKIQCKNYTIHDSWRILPMSLHQASEDFNLEHGKLDLWNEVEKKYPKQYIDIKDYLDRCDKSDPLFIEYLGYDVLSLYELIMKLIDITKLNKEEFVGILTTASLSKYLFKHGYDNHDFSEDYEKLTYMGAWSSNKPIKANLDEKGKELSWLDVENIIRQAYYGGRTEVFKPILEEIVNQIVGYHYDVNSLYPANMKDKLFPIGFPQFFTGSGASLQWETWLSCEEGLGFITANVYIPKQHIPPLPVKKDGKLVFVCGHIHGSWTFHELAYAVKNCEVKVEKIKNVVYFANTYPVFHNIVDTFYSIKENASKTGNKSLKTFAKLILNTLYGWTMLNRDDKTELCDYKKGDKLDPKRIIYKNEKLKFYLAKSVVISDSIQPQIGSYVISYSRIYLLDMMRKIYNEFGAEIYYCDTDSIVTNKKLPDIYVDKTQLGKWDCEGELYKGLFLQPKVYCEIVKKNEEQSLNKKFKGVRKETQKNYEYDFYNNLMIELRDKTKERVLIDKDIERLRSIAYTQKNDIDYNYKETLDKNLKVNNIQKRIIDYRKNTTEPWYFKSLSDFNSFRFDRPTYTLENMVIDTLSLPTRG